MKRLYFSGGLLIIGLTIVLLCLRWHHSNHFRIRRSSEVDSKEENQKDSDEIDENILQFSFEDFDFYSQKIKNENNFKYQTPEVFKSENCRMNNCFDFEICRKHGFKERIIFTLIILLAIVHGS